MRGYPIRNIANGRSGQFAGAQGLWSGRDGLRYTINWGSAPGSLLPPGFSLTRADPGTYYDSSGLLQTAGANVARGTYRYPTTAPQSGQWGYLPGTASSYFSTPDSAANRITSDIDIRAKIAPDTWTPSGYYNIISKWVGATYDYTFQFNNTGGTLLLAGNNGAFAAVSTAATGFSAGVDRWVRVTRVASSGIVTFYTSTDGVSWTQLGASVAGASGNISTNTVSVGVGGNSSGPAPFSGKVYQVQIYNGIDGTLAVNFNANDYTSGTTWTASTTGETWTRNGNATIQWPWVFDGTIVEAAATNSCLRSAEFDNASWAKANSTVTANSIASPSGATDADSIVEDGTTAAHYVLQGFTFSAAVYTFSVFLKAGTRSWGFLNLLDSASQFNAYFNLSAGTVGTVSASTTARIEPAGNGWYRCSVSATCAAGAATGMLIAGASADNGASYLGVNGNVAVYAYGSQLELGSAPTSYIPTTTAAVLRSADVLTAPTSGLLVNGQGFAAIGFRTIALTVPSGFGSLVSSFSGSGGVPLIWNGATGNASLFDGAVVRNGPPTTVVPGVTHKWASSWAGANCAVGVNGAVTSGITFDGSMDLGATLRIGSDVSATGQDFSMVLQSLRLGIVPASAARLGNLTA